MDNIEAFEEWFWKFNNLDDYNKPEYEQAKAAWQAAKADSTKEIAEKSVVIERLFEQQNRLIDANDELHAHINELREALEHADESLKGIDSAHDTPEIIRKALAKTPAQSLAEYRNKVIDQCAKIADNRVYGSNVATEIRSLKRT